MYFLIIAFVLYILLSNIKVALYNVEKTNYIKVNILLFTMYIVNDSLLESVKDFSLNKNSKFQQQFSKYKKHTSLFKDVFKKTIVKKAEIIKFVDDYNKTYQTITLYLLSSYLKTYLFNSCKEIQYYNYELKFKKNRNDLDFSIVLQISIIDLILAVIKSKFLKKKRSLVNGS